MAFIKFIKTLHEPKAELIAEKRNNPVITGYFRELLRKGK